MAKIYENPEAELILLRPNAATAYIPGTDGDRSGNPSIGDGGLDMSGGGEENDRYQN